jgi:hypothetical protein
MPTCFISYSWDNEKHKEWVRLLAEKLHKSGVWTYLDQWDLNPGANLTNYMESKIREANYVLLICTPHFAKKANDGSGGVGYEKSIVSGEIFYNISSPEKFVPLVREGSPKDSLPSYLQSKIFIDFRDDNKIKEGFEQLLRHIHKKPKYARPELGKPPDFKPKKEASMLSLKKAKASPKKLSREEVNALNLKRDPFFIKYKEGLYGVLKNKGFEFNKQENLHTKIFEHKGGEKLYLIVAEAKFYDKSTKKEEPHFLFVREYIYYEKNDKGEFKKVIATENQSIPMTHSFNEKKALLNTMLGKMESHILVDEGDIEKNSRQSAKISDAITAIFSILVAIFVIWILSKCG